MLRRLLFWLCSVSLIVALGVAGWFGYQRWRTKPADTNDGREHGPVAAVDDQTTPVRLSPQARKNLNLAAKPVQLTTYWRTVELPGVVIDRPGISDRGVVAPIAGVITEIHAFPGATVSPGAALFTLKLRSETLQASQLELFKATREIELAQQQHKRLSALTESGALAKSRIIEIENQLERLQVNVEAYRQDLESRGLTEAMIEAAAKGEFLAEFTVRAPMPDATAAQDGDSSGSNDAGPDSGRKAAPFSFEVQSLDAQLGQQVEAGAVLCHLADHRDLLIEGRGFKDDMPLVQQAARNGWKVEVDFESSESTRWPSFERELRIQHVANSVDPESRTFAFFIPLENQWESYTQDGVLRLLWRFRPGTRLRLRIPVERLDNIIVLPQDAVVREGPEAYVFRQNGDLFNRRPVQILHEDRLSVVVANDGSIRPGFFIAQNGAAALNRVRKAQLASGAPNVHVHADGTVHAAH
jgi:membrane fusion protein, heavy metal efflux system